MNTLSGAKIKNTTDMANFLLDQVDNVVNGTTEPKKMRVLISISQQVCGLKNLEIRAALAARKLEGKEVQPVTFRRK